ncbi:LysR family transcriptional regulator [Loktanella sp. SALINAS62]|uniref:LysR family transcriptional regulator n=1 Tax=Loktanella sp. SALINAS62 TaxID=2706124 RepID=UPI001B8D4CD9|nr:LysR family transcriptional regulator [Loktanella sp. SALINAS62]MBS1302747.1 LysR family transcriptional regulator [Loktanella sp. SALINAS62]
MKIDEKHLAQLAAVIEAGGVTEGANLLGLSQPAVSRTLSALQKRLGEPLFMPGRRPLVPTIIGRQLAAHGKVILEAGRKASETVDGFRSGSAGTVRIAGVPFFMDAVISRMIGQFQVKWPDIRVDQSYGNLPEIQAGLRSGQLDMAICPLGMVEPGSELDFTEILPGRNVVAARVRHPIFRKKSVTSTDLLRYPWIAPLPGSPLLADIHSILLSIGMSEVNVRYSGGSLMSVLNYLEETDALTVLPQSVLFAFRQTGKFKTVPMKIPQPERSLGILRLKNAPSLPTCDKLVRFISVAFDDLRAIILRHENAVIWSA